MESPRNGELWVAREEGQEKQVGEGRARPLSSALRPPLRKAAPAEGAKAPSPPSAASGVAGLKKAVSSEVR